MAAMSPVTLRAVQSDMANDSVEVLRWMTRLARLIARLVSNARSS